MDTMLIKREDFSKFLNSIELIQDHCNDAEILDGKLRQRSNDKYTVFDFDFSNAVGGLSFMVSGLKNKISLLRSLELDTALLSDEETEKNIIVSVDETHYTFSDMFSTIKFRIPMKKYLDNVYLTDDEFSKKFKINEEDLILHTVVNSHISKRVKIISRGFENDVITLHLDGFNATFTCETSNKENSSEIIKGIELNRKMPKCTAKVSALPFTMELVSDLTLSVYQVSSKIILIKSSMRFFGIPIVIYVLSELLGTK